MQPPPERPRPRFAVFRTPDTDAAARVLACSGAGMQEIGAWLASRRLGCHAAVLVDSGAGWLESEAAGRIRIEAPALFFLFPGERHSYGPDQGTNWHEHWVLFEGTLAAAFAASGMIDRRRPAVEIDRAARFAALFARIRRELAGGGPFSGAATAAVVHELIVESRRAVRRPKPGLTDDSARPIAEAIRSAAETPIDFEALARSLGLSPATMRRRMVGAYGRSPKAYQLRLRIDRAKELLALGERSIESVARAVGFEDSYYFSRLFRSHEGISPSRFRAENARR